MSWDTSRKTFDLPSFNLFLLTLFPDDCENICEILQEYFPFSATKVGWNLYQVFKLQLVQAVVVAGPWVSYDEATTQDHFQFRFYFLPRESNSQAGDQY